MADNLVHVLVVEDEQEIRELMALHLLRQGYKVTECSSAEEALNEMNRNNFQVFVLDWMLPGLSGVDIVEKIKAKNPHASVLMVTAKTEAQDIVSGLEKGADDYMTKPFVPSVFIARIKALLRRYQPGAVTAADSGDVQVAGLRINFKSYEISYNGEALHLTPSEFKLLGALVQNPGCVLTREQLIENIRRIDLGLKKIV